MNRIKQEREQLGLGQKELAEEVGLTQQVISLYESEKRKPKLETYQKLANFFGVSVAYLRGEEPDFSLITQKTRITFSLILDNYYFGYKNDNYSLFYEIGKEIYSVSNLSEEEWSKFFSKYLISAALSKKIYSNVNKYVELSHKAYPITGTDLINNYWMKEFSFLLQENRLIRHINRILFRNSKRKDMSGEEVISECNLFANLINKNIYEEIVRSFSTGLGKYVSEKYYDEFSILESNFKLALRTSNSIQGMRKSVRDYNAALIALIDKLKLDKTSGKLNEYVQKEKEREKLRKEVKVLYQEFAELYKKDKEFRDFAQRYEEKHPGGMRIIDKTKEGRNRGKVNNINISKRNELPCLYLYKNKKGEDTNRLQVILKKYSSILEFL